MPRPADAELRAALALIAPLRTLARPMFLGLERVPSARPLLFVGNHTIYGLLDVPFLFAELYERKGIALRSLADHVHFRIPIWRDLLTRFGAVDGTRAECARLMEAGAAILVFPGGAREVSKRKGERYRLIWKERLGFARMAIAHGATIVPFASVGIDDAFDVVVDADEIFASPLGRILTRLGVRRDVVLPLAIPTSRPERLYFQFCEPIHARDFGADATSDGAASALRDAVKVSVENAIAALISVRERDPKRRLGTRITSRFQRDD